jgi:hypothetical protein
MKGREFYCQYLGRPLTCGQASVHFDGRGQGVYVTSLMQTKDIEKDFKSICESIMDGMALGIIPVNPRIVFTSFLEIDENLQEKLCKIGSEYDLIFSVNGGKSLSAMLLADIDLARRIWPKEVADRFIGMALKTLNS